MISVAREAPAPHNNKAIETDSRHISEQRGEELALELLTSNRLEPVHRYYRCRVGELNLVMRDSELLVFIEVRYRKHIRFGGAAESVEARKRLRLTRAALMYCARKSVLQKNCFPL